MSLPKKGSRKINVENTTYLWRISHGLYGVNLIIAPIENGPKILSSFDYYTAGMRKNAGSKLFVITPYIVKEVILFAMEKGYSPNDKSTQMDLGDLTRKIKLDLSKVARGDETKVKRGYNGEYM